MEVVIRNRRLGPKTRFLIPHTPCIQEGMPDQHAGTFILVFEC